MYIQINVYRIPNLNTSALNWFNGTLNEVLEIEWKSSDIINCLFKSINTCLIYIYLLITLQNIQNRSIFHVRMFEFIDFWMLCLQLNFKFTQIYFDYARSRIYIVVLCSALSNMWSIWWCCDFANRVLTFRAYNYDLSPTSTLNRKRNNQTRSHTRRRER